MFCDHVVGIGTTNLEESSAVESAVFAGVLRNQERMVGVRVDRGSVYGPPGYYLLVDRDFDGSGLDDSGWEVYQHGDGSRQYLLPLESDLATRVAAFQVMLRVVYRQGWQLVLWPLCPDWVIRAAVASVCHSANDHSHLQTAVAALRQNLELLRESQQKIKRLQYNVQCHLLTFSSALSDAYQAEEATTSTH